MYRKSKYLTFFIKLFLLLESLKSANIIKCVGVGHRHVEMVYEIKNQKQRNYLQIIITFHFFSLNSQFICNHKRKI